VHHDWLFNFRVLQLRLYSTETIMQLAEFVINVIKLCEMPARLKTHLVISSHRREKKIMKIVGYIAKREAAASRRQRNIISYIFHAHRRHYSVLTLGFRLCAEKSRRNGKMCFSFRFKNRSLFWSHTNFHLREEKERAKWKNTFSLLFSVSTFIQLEITVSIFKQIPFFTCINIEDFILVLILREKECRIWIKRCFNNLAILKIVILIVKLSIIILYVKRKGEIASLQVLNFRNQECLNNQIMETLHDRWDW